jgi:hypothetical protein
MDLFKIKKVSKMRPFCVRGEGVEPSQHCCQWILSPSCLPVPPSPHLEYKYSRKNLKGSIIFLIFFSSLIFTPNNHFGNYLFNI